MKGYVTFDTSWFERYRFDFSFPGFRCLPSSGYQVVISEVVDREIKNHLMQKTEEAFNSVIKASSQVPFLTHTHPLFLRKSLDLASLKTAALASYEGFKSTVRATIIPIRNCNINLVVDAYFTESGVFTSKNKKSEFPDAIAVDSIVNYVKGHNLTVFSCDNDWSNALSSNPQVTIYADKKDLLKLISTEEYISEVAEAYIDSQKNDLIEFLRPAFSERISEADWIEKSYFHIDSYEVNDFDFVLKEIKSLLLLEGRSGEKERSVGVFFGFSFVVDCSFNDYSHSIYDKELQSYFGVVRRTVRVLGEESGYCFANLTFEDGGYHKVSNCYFDEVDFCLKNPDCYIVLEMPLEDEDYCNLKG